MDEDAHLGYYKHDRLPHFDRANLLQFITFVMADAAPRNRLPHLKKTRIGGDRVFELLDAKLDEGAGSCMLRKPEIATLVEFAILANSGITHLPIAWVVMPNHVHILTKQLPNFKLARIVRQIKSGSAALINKQLSRRGQFWQLGYFDRAVRDIAHLSATIDYIHYNPVKAGLANRESQWRFSSIHSFDEKSVMDIIENSYMS